MGPALIAAGLVGPTCVAAGPGPELTSSHGGSRCVTTIVPVSDSGESALVALRAQGLRYTWQVACILTADLGLRAVPTILYCVGLHNSWQGMPWSTSQWTAPWRSTQRLFFWQENSSPTYLTSQLRNGYGAAVTTTEAREGPAGHAVQALVTEYQSHHLPRGYRSAHTEKYVAGIHTKNSPCTRNIRLRLHRDTPTEK